MLGKLFVSTALAFVSCITPAAADTSGCSQGQVGVGFEYTDTTEASILGLIFADNCGIITQATAPVSYADFQKTSICDVSFVDGTKINCDDTLTVLNVTFGNGQIFSSCTRLATQGLCGTAGVAVCCAPN